MPLDLIGSLIVACSETFNLKNSGKTIAQAFDDQIATLHLYKRHKVEVRWGIVFTAFGCNYESDIPLSVVLDRCKRLLQIASDQDIQHIVVAATNATFADTHVRVGVLPGWGGSQLLAQTVGPMRARYIALTGNYIDAATAKDWGLVLDVVLPEQLMPHCRNIAQDILSADQGTMRDYRGIMREGLKKTAEEGCELESRIGKARLARFGAANFRKTREQVMKRGQGQAGKDN